MHRLSAYQAAEWTQSGLAAAPLPYLAVFIHLILYLGIIGLILIGLVIDLIIDLDLSDYFDLFGYRPK